MNTVQSTLGLWAIYSVLVSGVTLRSCREQVWLKQIQLSLTSFWQVAQLSIIEVAWIRLVPYVQEHKFPHGPKLNKWQHYPTQATSVMYLTKWLAINLSKIIQLARVELVSYKNIMPPENRNWISSPQTKGRLYLYTTTEAVKRGGGKRWEDDNSIWFVPRFPPDPKKGWKGGRGKGEKRRASSSSSSFPFSLHTGLALSGILPLPPPNCLLINSEAGGWRILPTPPSFGRLRLLLLLLHLRIRLAAASEG